MEKENPQIFDASRFAEILAKAKGKRTQKQFASDAKVSAVHMNNMLNAKINARPTLDTLFKLSLTAENNVTFPDLCIACGYKAGVIETYEDIHQELSQGNLPDSFSYGAVLFSKRLTGLILTILKDRGYNYRTITWPMSFDDGLVTCALFNSSVDLWQFRHFTHTNSNLEKEFICQLGYIANTNYNEISTMPPNDLMLQGKVNPDWFIQDYTFKSPKVSFVIEDKTEYDTILKRCPAPNLTVPVSIILADYNSYDIVKEEYLKTAYTGDLSNLPSLKKTE